MIRREVGSEYHLIEQNAHARLSRQLAERWGNADFERPQRRESVLIAIGQHDAGWPMHDEQPTLNPAGQPLDVFETPWSISLNIWAASAQLAADIDPYAGLLVSLHSLSLSTRIQAADSAARFHLNKFQHREVERQEQLRGKLGLRTDLPLTLGLCRQGVCDEEDSLIFNFNLLQLMDLISLWVCCSRTTQLQRRPAAVPIEINPERPGVVGIHPWPFDIPRIELSVPYRAVAGKPYADNEQLQVTYRHAPVEAFDCVVGPTVSLSSTGVRV